MPNPALSSGPNEANMIRDPDELLTSALAVIDQGFATGVKYKRIHRPMHPEFMAPLFSSGNDSLCACHVASQHPRFGGKVYMIDTGIGAQAARDHAWATCQEHGWQLVKLKSPDTYEKFIRERGFPGPGMHQWAYNRLKERCVRMIVRRKRVALITGCRSQESVRRMGHVEPIKVGNPTTRNGVEVMESMNWYWLAPCHDWSAEEQSAYIDAHGLTRNPLKVLLGMSGECFCGAFASPGEYDRVRRFAPDVADEIDRLTEIAKECGKHAVWGTRPPGSQKGKVQVKRSGPLCGGCEVKAAACGVEFVTDSPTPAANV